MSDFNSNFQFSKKFYKQMCRILGPYMISPAPDIDDKEKCTDLMVLQAKAKRIACRIRHYDYLKYSNQMTIRYRSTIGGKTEFEKLFVDNIQIDYYLYGFSNQDETDIITYKLIEWNKFKTKVVNGVLDKSIICDKHIGYRPNTDGTSFVWYNMDYFDDCILERKEVKRI